jgi:hypothetical protein
MEFIYDSYLSVDFTDIFCAFVLWDFDVDIVTDDKFASVLKL